MCSRYYVDKSMEADMLRLCGQENLRPDTGTADSRVSVCETPYCGDIRPTEFSSVMVWENGSLAVKRMRWGFLQTRENQKRLLINARAENVLERAAFRDSVLERRCVIGARHFYEWDRAKEKVEFHRGDGTILYLAGIYKRFEDGDHFVILTTEANASVRPVHDRMPLILEENEVKDWICRRERAEALLGKMPRILERRQEFEQQEMVLFWNSR